MSPSDDAAGASGAVTSRHGAVVGVRPERREEYLRLHAEVWPQVEAMISACHIRNYTIFIHDDLLFSYFEYTGTDLDADLARMAADPVTREWWSHTDPCQVRLAGTPDGATWKPIQEVWHLP